MSIRDAARIAALETRVSELTARLEKLELAAEAVPEPDAGKTKRATPRRWRN
jgi:hypothetical protein